MKGISGLVMMFAHLIQPCLHLSSHELFILFLVIVMTTLLNWRGGFSGGVQSSLPMSCFPIGGFGLFLSVGTEKRTPDSSARPMSKSKLHQICKITVGPNSGSGYIGKPALGGPCQKRGAQGLDRRAGHHGDMNTKQQVSRLHCVCSAIPGPQCRVALPVPLKPHRQTLQHPVCRVSTKIELLP